LIHANGENDYPLARLVARILRIPVSCHIHNGNPRSRDFCQWLFSKEPRPARLVFVSDCQRQQNAAALAGILPSEHCITVHNGVDIEAFRPADAQFRTLSRNAWGLDESAYVVAVIASVKAHKQNHHILEVLGLLRQRGVDAIGVLAGPILEPEYGRWILAEAEKQGLADQVKVLGNIEQVQQAYAAADVVACFSQSEGFSLVTLEAMACGKAIVSYNHPAQVEAIGDAGVCVEMNRHDLVAAVCLELYREPNRREEVGRAARRRVEDSFSASSVSRKLQGVFQAILDEAAGARQERSRRG
jgi:glycosyltransferase involved in cell wall biosynthesis